MRFVPGTNLRHLVDAGPLEMGQVLLVTRSVASALDAAHERGLVHRDVKPANILISGEGDRRHVYLTDFGLTKRLGSRRQPHAHGRVGRHARLRRARADPVGPGGRPGRHLLVGLRALRDADGQRRLSEGQRHGEAVGARHRPAALAEPDAPRARPRLRRDRRAGDRQGPAPALRHGLGARRRRHQHDRGSPELRRARRPPAHPTGRPAERAAGQRGLASAPPPPPPSEHDLFISEPVEPAAAIRPPRSRPPSRRPPRRRSP